MYGGLLTRTVAAAAEQQVALRPVVEEADAAADGHLARCPSGVQAKLKRGANRCRFG